MMRQEKVFTMIVSTAGPGDDSEISRLARYPKRPEPGEPQFGSIGKITEHWIEENARW